jgi:deazaflavin-dependent oxidoreductase (nitroreductase family)
LYVDHQGAAIVTGTNLGGDRHPGWALNLLDQPEATLRIDGVSRPVRARRLTEDERLAMWPELVAIWPGYDGYIERSGRLPLTFALEAAE